MKKTISLVFSVIVLISSAFGGDNFILSSVDEAQQLSKSSKKPMLLIFGADYCSYCVILKDNILQEDYKELMEPFIVCYVDVEEHPNLKDKYSVSIIPHSKIIYSDGSVRSMEGYSKNLYKKWLKNDK